MPLMQTGLAVERSQERSIHVKARGHVIYLIIRRETGWKVYPKTTARQPSAKDHPSAHLAAKSYLKGPALKAVGKFGDDIEHEIALDAAAGSTVKFDYAGPRISASREHHDFVLWGIERRFPELLIPVEAWVIDQFGPAGIKRSGWARLLYGFEFADPVKATAFRVRWC